jgi:Mitochondrial branched-chain alpha-ketoacid dehydrogenase kinase
MSNAAEIPTRSLVAIPDLDSEIREYSSLPQTTVSLQMLMKAGHVGGGPSDNDDLDATWTTPLQKRSLYHSQRSQERVLLSMARLLRQEIPIRLAQRISDLDRVPFMRDMPSVLRVKDVYRNSFRALRVVPPIVTAKDESDFAYLLSQLYEKHSGVLVEMARGAYELRESLLRSNSDPHNDFALLSECHAFLDRFYTSRIGASLQRLCFTIPLHELGSKTWSCRLRDPSAGWAVSSASAPIPVRSRLYQS